MENRRFAQNLIRQQIGGEQIISNEDTKSVLKLKQFYMSFEDKSKQLNEFISYIQSIDLKQGFHLDDFQKEQVQKIFVHFVEMFKRLIQKSKDLADENQTIQKYIQENDILRQEIQRLNEVILQLQDIQHLCNQQQQKLRLSILENSISKDRIMELQAYSKQLKNEKQQSVISYETYVENKSQQLLQLNQKIAIQALKLDQLTKQLSQQKQRTYASNKKLQEAHQRNFELQQQIENLDRQLEQLKQRQVNFDYGIYSKFQNSLKQNSIRDDSSAIQQCSHEDDHQQLKIVQKSYQDIFKQPIVQHKQKQFKLMKKTSISKIDTKSNYKKPEVHRRNTMQQSIKLQKVQNNELKQYLLKPASNKPDKLDITNKSDLKLKKKKLVIGGQMRSTGNSPTSVRVKNVLKSEVNSKKPSHQDTLSIVKRQLQQQKKQNHQLKEQVRYLREQILIKCDEISQLQGGIQISEDNQRKLEQQLNQYKSKLQASMSRQFQNEFTFKKYLQKQRHQHTQNLMQKLKYEEYIFQLEQACSAFREEIKVAESQLEKRRRLCLKFKQQRKSLIQKIHDYEQALDRGLCPKIQDIFGRICQQQQQQVDLYQSPQRILSRRNSLRNSKRVLHTDRAKYQSNNESSYQEQYKNQVSQIKMQQNNQYLRLGLQSIKKQQINKSQDFQSPKDSETSLKYNHGQGIRNHQSNNIIVDQSYNQWPSSLNLRFRTHDKNPHQMPEELQNEEMIGQNYSFLNAFDGDGKSSTHRLQFVSNVYELHLILQKQNVKSEGQECQNDSEMEQNKSIQCEDNVVEDRQIANYEAEINEKEKHIQKSELDDNACRYSKGYNTVQIQTDLLPLKQQFNPKQIQQKQDSLNFIQSEMQTQILSLNSHQTQTDFKPITNHKSTITQILIKKNGTCQTNANKTINQESQTTVVMTSENQCQTQMSCRCHFVPQTFSLTIKSNIGDFSKESMSTQILPISVKESCQVQDSFENKIYTQQHIQKQEQPQLQPQLSGQLQGEGSDHQSVTKSALNSVPLSPFNQNICNFKSQGASTQISPQQSKVDQIDKTKIYLQNNKIMEQKEADEDKKDTILRKSHQRKQNIARRTIKQFAPRQSSVSTQIEFHTGKKLFLVKQQEELDFQTFNKTHKWDLQNIYEIQAQRILKNGTISDKLILWRKGIISVQLKSNLLSKGFSKAIKDSRMIILGNSQIVIDHDIITTRNCSKNYYSGNLGQHKWKIKTVTVYQ